MSRPEEMRFIQQSILMPLDDLIGSQSVWYKQRLDELPGFREAVTAPDGHIYDFGTVGGCFHCKYGQKMWINQTWLDRLGLEMPTNTDEFYEVMKAFKEQDANGNGDPNDEWPLNTAKAGAWVQIDGFLMMPFQFSDVRQSQVRRLYVEDGKIKAAYMQPGYREGLRYLKRMWDEGLIYPDSFAQDRDQSRRLNQSGEHAIFGAVPAMHHGYFSVGSGPEVRWREYAGVPPLDGPAGRETPYYGYPFNTGTTFLTSQARLPEVAFRLIDWLYSDEGSTAGSYGQEGKSWRSPESGELAVNGKPARIAPLAVPEDDPYYQNYTWGNRSSYFSFLHSWRSSHQDYMVPGPGRLGAVPVRLQRSVRAVRCTARNDDAAVVVFHGQHLRVGTDLRHPRRVRVRVGGSVHHRDQGHRHQLGLLPGRAARHRRGALPGDYPGGVRQQRVRQVAATAVAPARRKLCFRRAVHCSSEGPGGPPK